MQGHYKNATKRLNTAIRRTSQSTLDNSESFQGEGYQLMRNDDNSVYYLNWSTGQTTWTKPVGKNIWVQMFDPNRNCLYVTNLSTNETALQCLYEEYFDQESGMKYYYNTCTQEPTWTCPEWIDKYDKITRSIFYYNNKLSISQWYAPPNFYDCVYRMYYDENNAINPLHEPSVHSNILKDRSFSTNSFDHEVMNVSSSIHDLLDHEKNNISGSSYRTEYSTTESVCVGRRKRDEYDDYNDSDGYDDEYNRRYGLNEANLLDGPKTRIILRQKKRMRGDGQIPPRPATTPPLQLFRSSSFHSSSPSIEFTKQTITSTTQSCLHNSAPRGISPPIHEKNTILVDSSKWQRQCSKLTQDAIMRNSVESPNGSSTANHSPLSSTGYYTPPVPPSSPLGQHRGSSPFTHIQMSLSNIACHSQTQTEDNSNAIITRKLREHALSLSAEDASAAMDISD